MDKKILVICLVTLMTLTITGCNSKSIDEDGSSKVIKENSSKIEVSNIDEKNIKDGIVEYNESGVKKFIDDNSYNNFKIEASNDKTYYWYDEYGLVVDKNDLAKRVIKEGVVYITDGDQYWKAVDDYDDDPVSIDNVVLKDKYDYLYKKGDWYFEEYEGLDEDIVNIYKYKVKDNKITVAKVEFSNKDKEPFNGKVIEEITYTITEVKNKNDVPMVNLDYIEEVSVTGVEEINNYEKGSNGVNNKEKDDKEGSNIEEYIDIPDDLDIDDLDIDENENEEIDEEHWEIIENIDDDSNITDENIIEDYSDLSEEDDTDIWQEGDSEDIDVSMFEE